jgi:hypothetical protein
MRLGDVEREPNCFPLLDSQPLFQYGHDLRLTRMGDQMRFRARWLHKGNGARRSRLRILGFPGFMPTGSPKFLFERFGLTAESIEKAARKAISARSA